MHAKFFQQLVISQASLAFSQKNLRVLGKIRVYDMSMQTGHEGINQTSSTHLERIGKFIQDCYLFHTGKLRPCVIVGPPNNQDYCLVVAKTTRSIRKKNKCNSFSLALRRAAEKARSKHRNPSFNSSV